MRVAFLMIGFPVLSETFILDQITGLIERNIELDLYAQKYLDAPKEHSELHTYKLMSKLKYPNPKLSSKFSRLSKFPGSFITNMSISPRTVFGSLNIFKYGISILSLRLFYESIAFLRETKYDLIHAHFGPLGNHALILKELNAIQGKLVTSFHGFDLSRYLTMHGENVYKRLFLNGDLFLPISVYWKNKLIDLGCEERKTKVHHMGIDLNSFQFLERQVCFIHEVRLLSVARLTEKKGIKYAIKAVANLLATTNLNVRYQIIGDGPLRKTLQFLVNELNLQNHVLLLGLKTRSEIVRYLKESDILLAPSVSASDGDMEGIPMVLMEAMAMGLPVVSTYHSGIPELVSDGVTGFIVPERDEIALSKTVVKITQSVDTVASIVENARHFVEENFNIDIQNDDLVNIY